VTAYRWGIGVRSGALLSTTSTAYTFDGYGNATQVATTLTDNDSASPYAGEQWTTTTATSITPDAGSNWCLTQPTEVQVTKSAPGEPTITRTVTYSPDYQHCREGERLIEPASPAYAVTQVLSYDSFGNLNGIATTGLGMSTRSIAINWGTTGQFPASVTNALGQTSFMTFDPVWGLQTSATDPNGISTSWQYDAIGRKVRETRPDATSTVWTYNDCANAGGCLLGAHTLAVTHAVYNTDGSTETDGTTYFDELERPLIWNTRLLATGTYSRNEVRYDSLGRTVEQAMPCTWSAVTTACPYWTTTAYDVLNRPVEIERPESASNSTLQATTIVYQGDTVITTDAQGKQSTKITNAAGLLGLSKDDAGYYQSFGYDAFGSLVAVTDSLSNTLFAATYDYGIKPLQRSLSDMDLGSRSFTYDALGELVAYSDSKGQNFSVNYDALGRPTTRTEPDLTTTWTWGNTAAQYNIGQLASVSANSYAESFAYDRDGRMTDRTITIPSDGTYSYDYAYNATTGLLDTLTYPVSTSGYRPR
jgi:YD repeat-containing protein